MKLTKTATAMLVPAAAAGAALSGCAAVHAAVGHPASQARHARRRQVIREEVTATHRLAAKRHAPHRRAWHRPPSLFSGMSAFEQCVAWRESGDNPAASSAGLFGILPATWASLGFPGTAGQSPAAMQKAAFGRLYAQDGTQPWAPYDGC